MVFRLVKIASMIIAVFSILMFHQNYWRFRDSFDENGRYFDFGSGVVYSSQSGIGWGFLASIAVITGLLMMMLEGKRNRD